MRTSLRWLSCLGLGTLLVCAAPQEAGTAGLPNLSIGGVGWSYPNKALIRVYNNGDSAAGPFRVHIRSHWNGSYHTVVNFIALPLAANSYQDYAPTYGPYPRTYMMYYIDVQNSVAESDEGDNIKYVTW